MSNFLKFDQTKMFQIDILYIYILYIYIYIYVYIYIYIKEMLRFKITRLYI